MENKTITWTSSRLQLLPDLVKEGLTTSEIAGRLGNIPRNSVISKCRQLRLTLRFTRKRGEKRKTPINIERHESEPNIGQIKALASSGICLRQIATTVGLTREKISGLARTHGIHIVDGRSLNQIRRTFRFEKAAHPEILSDTSSSGFIAHFSGDGISLMKAGPEQCRWPYDGKGIDGAPRCCGVRTTAGIQYCIDHARAAFIATRIPVEKIAFGRSNFK